MERATKCKGAGLHRSCGDLQQLPCGRRGSVDRRGEDLHRQSL